MTSLAEIRQRLEKGCGRDTNKETGRYEEASTIWDGEKRWPIMYKCGETYYHCQICKAQLKILDEIDGEIQKSIDAWYFEWNEYVLSRNNLNELKQKLLGVTK